MEQKIKAVKKILRKWKNKNKTIDGFYYLEKICDVLNVNLRKYTEKGKNGFKTVIKILDIEGFSLNNDKKYSITAASFDCIKSLLNKFQIPIHSVVGLEEAWLQTQSQRPNENKNDILCPICDKNIKLNYANEHVKQCHETKINSYEISCRKCQKKIPIANWSSHCDICWITVCYKCTEKVKSEDFQKHASECWIINKPEKKQNYNLRKRNRSLIPIIEINSDSDDKDSSKKMIFHCAACLQPVKST